MSARRSFAHIRSLRSRRTATAALASAGVAAIALGVLPVQADAQQSTATTGGSAAWDLKAADLPGQQQPTQDAGGSGGASGDGSGGGSRVSLETGLNGVRAIVGQQDRQDGQNSHDGQGRAGAQAQDQGRENAGKREAQRVEERQQAQRHERQQERQREQAQEQRRQPASRGAAAQPPHSAEPAATQRAYPYTLDGWIRHALVIMDDHGIPGTYDGLYRNIMRESSGDPNAINLWDINAQNGTPSIGLLQVIQPTFDAYHVPGTSLDIRNPVSNIVAAANYAADRYGSIDNVFSAY